MISTQNRIALITGGSSGIGLEMARLMLEQGSKVIICSRSPQKLDAAKKQLPRVTAIQCDVTLQQDLNNLSNRIAEEFPGLNLLMNNAGISQRFLLESTGDLAERLEAEWRTNYRAPVLLTQQLLPLLKKNSGTVVNVTSGLANIPLSVEPDYCATKAALQSMTQSMRVRYAKIGVKVVEILYPEVDTPFNEGQPTANAISPQTAAREALRQLNRGRAEIHIGMARMLRLMRALAPKQGIRMLNGFIPEQVEELLRGR